MLMWIFDYKDFSVKDIVEVADFTITMDEETNANSFVEVLKNTTATANDIIALKEKEKTVYWGIIEQITNENGQTLYTYTLKYITNLFDRKIKIGDKNIISERGIEDFLESEILTNFTQSDDNFANFNYIDIVVKTHTKKGSTVSNVENNLYNFHTWLTNCTQNYDIIYSFEIINKRLQMTIERAEKEIQLIDCNAQGITNYKEVFETNVISKVIAIGPTEEYTLYLKTNRTTTEDKNDPERAAGKIETIYVEDDANLRQEAINQMRASTYNHNISFNSQKKYDLGVPIAIKTRNSIIYNTYISSITITQSNFIEYQCGNIRINFLEKLLKERR